MSDSGLISNLTQGVYIIAGALFILGLIRLRSPATARSGNMLSAVGMLLAVVFTLVNADIIEPEWMIIGLVVGSVIGVYMSRTVQMTAMPQMVAVFNGFGGGVSALVAAAELLRLNAAPPIENSVTVVTIMASTIVGSVTLTGSFIAFGKLQGLVASRPVLLPLRNAVNASILLGALGVAGYLIFDFTTASANATIGGLDSGEVIFVVMVGLALVLGVLIVIPIGGADMPVVVALLNSYSGLAAAAAGFVLDNNMLIIAGSLVGASGLILTRIMTKAMNRSLANVMLGGFGVADSTSNRFRRTEASPVGDRRGRRYRAGIRTERHLRPGLRPRRGPGAAQRQGTGGPPEVSKRGGQVRDPSGRRPNARPHECTAGRGKRPV